MYRVIIAMALVAGLMAPASATTKMTPAQRAAFLSSTACDLAEMNSPDIPAFEVRSSVEHGLQPDADAVRTRYAEYEKHGYSYFRDYIDKCKDAKRRNRALAIYNADTAAIRFALGKEWLTTMNLAEQQLARCVTDYHATTKGAECQTMLEENIKLKIKWQTAP